MAEQVDKFSRLRREALQLRRVSAAAAVAYEAERDTMLPLVDRKLIEREDLQRLIGSNPIALMRLNHRPVIRADSATQTPAYTAKLSRW